MSDATEGTSEAGPEGRIGERLAKAIAKTGYCSRREAERFIEAGEVSVNGETINHPAYFVTEQDEIAIRGRKLNAVPEAGLWVFHKPTHCLCTKSDPQGRETVFDFLPKNLRSLHLIGRLDFMSEGLLLLTNSPELKRYFELPTTQIQRRYLVQSYGPIPSTLKADLKKGVTIDGFDYQPIAFEISAQRGLKSDLLFTLTEGKNREIRNICAYFNIQIRKLIRLSYGDFELANLGPGDIMEVPKDQLPNLTTPQR